MSPSPITLAALLSSTHGVCVSSEQPTSIRLPREHLDRLRKESHSRQWSVSKLLREIVKQWCVWHSKQGKK